MVPFAKSIGVKYPNYVTIQYHQTIAHLIESSHGHWGFSWLLFSRLPNKK